MRQWKRSHQKNTDKIHGFGRRRSREYKFNDSRGGGVLCLASLLNSFNCLLAGLRALRFDWIHSFRLQHIKNEVHTF